MTLDELNRRLERMERRSARTRAVGLVAVGLLGAAFWIGRATAEEGAGGALSAPAFVLVDGSGTRKAALVPSEAGGARIEFYNGGGTVQIAVGMDEDGPMFFFDDEDGQRRIEMEISGTRGVFQLLDRQGVNVYQKRW